MSTSAETHDDAPVSTLTPREILELSLRNEGNKDVKSLLKDGDRLRYRIAKAGLDRKRFVDRLHKSRNNLAELNKLIDAELASIAK